MLQKIIRLAAKPRGFHLVTHELLSQLPELANFEQALAHCFIQHSSASLTINENTDPDVRGDMERYFLHSVPDAAPYFEHTLEGDDDMPAHIKASIIGSSITVPIQAGRLLLGTWQGIWLGEHRYHGGPRSIVVSLY